MKASCGIINFFVAFAFFSCKNNFETTKIDVTKVIPEISVNVSYKELDTDFLLSYPKNIILTDKYLIVQDDRGHNFYYHGINKNSGLMEYEFGEKGNGPGEILSTSINPFYDNLKGILQIFDTDRRSLCYYFIKDANTICNNVIDISAKYNLYLQNFFDLDSLYLATGMNGALDNKRFVVFDKSFELIDSFEEYPVLDYDKDKNKKFKADLLNIYFIKISPDKKNLAFASYKTGLFEIFSLNELPEKIIKVKSLLLAPPMKNNSENIFGFEDIFVTNEYIYTLYNGKTVDENPYYTKSIKVFNWNGDFIVEYHTGIDMRCLAVDEDNKTIYSIAYSDERGFFLIQINEMVHI